MRHRERGKETNRGRERENVKVECALIVKRLYMRFHNAGTFFHSLAATPDAKQAVLTVGGMLLSV